VQRYSARLRAQKSEQRQKAHRTVNSDCPVAQLSEAPMVKTQRPDDVAGAPDCPVRHATEASTNGYFGGWGYKYPQPPTLQSIQVFSLQTSYKSYSIQYKTQNKAIKSSPKSGITPTKLVTRESDICVHLSSCAWIAFLLLFLCSTHL
jgi:hypothetical protein